MSKQDETEVGHLVLKRKEGESIVIDGCVTIDFYEIKEKCVRVRITAPLSKTILRSELEVIEA